MSVFQECLFETIVFLGISFGIPILIFGMFRFWQVFIKK